MVTDLKKAYQSIHTGPLELHMRRFLFRESCQEEWIDYAFTRCTFGDVAAGLILEIAKRRVAEMGKDIDEQASQQLQDFSYVDDSIVGGSAEDVERMRGERVNGRLLGDGAGNLGARSYAREVYGGVQGQTTPGRRNS